MRSLLIFSSLGLVCLMLTAGCGSKSADQSSTGANPSTPAPAAQQEAGQRAAQQAAAQAAAAQAARQARPPGH